MLHRDGHDEASEEHIVGGVEIINSNLACITDTSSCTNKCANGRIRPPEQISVITDPDTESCATPWSLTTHIRNGVLRPMVHGHDQIFSSNVSLEETKR